MPIYNTGLIRAVFSRLRLPEMRTQRRYVIASGVVLLASAGAAVVYLFGQPNPQSQEEAALKIFAAMGVVIAIVIGGAFVVRKKSGPAWPEADDVRLALLRKGPPSP